MKTAYWPAAVDDVHLPTDEVALETGPDAEYAAVAHVRTGFDDCIADDVLVGKIQGEAAPACVHAD